MPNDFRQCRMNPQDMVHIKAKASEIYNDNASPTTTARRKEISMLFANPNDGSNAVSPAGLGCNP